MKTKKIVLPLAALIIMVAASISKAAEVKYCNPERSKPCGHGCIPLAKQCHVPWTTSKVGINPNKGSGPVYANPTYQETAPTSKNK